MYIQRLYIGLNDKDTHKQEFSKDCIVKLISNTLQRFNIYSFTLIEAKGYWLGEVEDTLIVIYSTANKETLIPQDVIGELRIILNQESIMQEVQEATISFV